ncbi:helix-turn-helix domain-containing protein [Megalodesulfovibrio paquesii]
MDDRRGGINPAAGAGASPTPDFEGVLSRLKQVFSVKTDTDLALELNLRQGSISAAKHKRSIPPAWITTVALSKGVSADWLLTGEGAMRRDQPSEGASLKRNADHPQRRAEDHDEQIDAFDMGDVLAQTIDILNSRTVYTTAIVSNIKAFHKAIVTERKLDSMQDQLDKALGAIQLKLDNLERENNQIREENKMIQAENRQLRLGLEHHRAGDAFEDTG